ncbi:hypothetical protein ES703_55745 [subsurface metagenome]
MLGKQRLSSQDIYLFLPAFGVLNQGGEIPSGYQAHGDVDVVVILISNPVGHAVLHAPGNALAVVELGEESHGVLALVEVCGIETMQVIMGDKRAMLNQMMIEGFGKVLLHTPVLQECLPLLQHLGLLPSGQETDILEFELGYWFNPEVLHLSTPVFLYFYSTPLANGHFPVVVGTVNET